MIDTKHHVKLNGILYRLAEDAEGEHYRNSGEPLRPPNAVMVQGEGRQDKFQARPDVLLWNITDWSGGEGQVRYDPDAHNRHGRLVNVDPFIQPGTLRPGYKVTMPGGGPSTTSVVVKTGSSIVAVELLYAAGIKHYVWSSGSWTGPYTWTGPSAKPNKGSVCGDDLGNIYFQEESTSNIWKATSGVAGAATQLTNSDINNTATGQMTFHNNYLYWMASYYGAIYEIDTTGTPMITPTNLWAGADARGSADNEITNYSDMCKANGKVYAAFIFRARGTTLYEITPTSAAGTGYVREVASYPGFYSSSIWAHNGLIFLAGASSSTIVNERIILYQNPDDGTFGTVGQVRHVSQEDYDGQMIGGEQANLLVSPIASGAAGTSSGNLRVWELDTVAGGVAQLAEYSVAAAPFQPVLSSDGIIVFAGTSTYLVNKKPDGTSIYADDDNCYAYSPWHDMGLSDEKILSSVVLSCERLPADWSINLKYQTSEDAPATFHNIGTYSTTNGTGTRYAVSTDTSTAKFRTVRIVVQFVYSGAGSPTTYPLLHGIEVRAQVAKPQGVFRLLLDMSDDHSGGSQNLSGAAKIANIKTAAALESVVAFQDGSLDREAGQWTEYDVVIDKYEFMVNHPGEGLGYVELREVV